MQGSRRPRREDALAGDHESSRPMGKWRWLGRCLPIRVILFQKFVRPLGFLARRSIDTSKRPNNQSNYQKINSLISKFTLCPFLLRSPVNIVTIFATQPEIWYDGSTYSGQVRDQTGISMKAGLAEYAC